MNDFYVTLPSHSSTNEFPNNAAHSFKIRLPHPIRLEGSGWKVGLAAVSLPDPYGILPNLMKNDNAVLFRTQWLSTDTTASHNPHAAFTSVFLVRDLKSVTNLAVLDGTTLLKDMITFFNKKKVERSLRKGWKLADANGENHTSMHFEWQGEDLVLHNHDVKLTRHNAEYYPMFFINANLAIYMRWFVNKGNNNYELGSNLTLEVPEGAIPDPLDLPSPTNNKFWQYGSSSGLIRLSLTCNWKFTSLNKAFGAVVKPVKRSLFIYSDVGSSGVVGNQVTDLLREVNYKREGKGSQYFEPLHIQYIPVRKDVLDIIETQVAETTGALTHFGEGNTIVTLHFKKTWEGVV